MTDAGEDLLKSLGLGGGESVTDDHEEADVSLGAKGCSPVVKVNVFYVVAVVIFNEKNEVLLIQESKKDCYGKWYLPAGRLEPGENILEAAKREVKEESGFDCEPTALLCVESRAASWYRFTLTGAITGGSLKTLSQKDGESLQAAWFSATDVIAAKCPLRLADIIPLVKLARERRKKPAESHQPPQVVLPLPLPHGRLLIRAVLMFRRKSADEELLLLLNREGRFPLVEFAVDHGGIPQAAAIIEEIFEKNAVLYEADSRRYITAVQFQSSKQDVTCNKARTVTDGFCLTILDVVYFEGTLPAVDKYSFARLRSSEISSHLSSITDLLPVLVAR